MENREGEDYKIPVLNYDLNTAKYFLSPKFQHIFTEKETFESDEISKDLRSFFEQTLKSQDRVALDITPSESTYKGEWLCQINTPTCVAFSIANSIKSLGIEPHVGFIRDLLNNTGHDLGYPDLKVVNGLSFYKALELFQTRRYKGLKVNVDYIDDKDQLSRVSANPQDIYDQLLDESLKISGYFIEDKEVSFDGYFKSMVETWKPQREKIIKHNANSIKEIINSGGRLIISVDNFIYKNGKGSAERRNHAICIVGYRISNIGFMNVETIDSGYGISWVSLEHLSFCLNDHCLVVKKKDQKIPNRLA